MTKKIVKANLETRRKVLWLLIFLGTLEGLALVKLTSHIQQIKELMERDFEAGLVALNQFINLNCGILGIVILISVIYLIKLGIQIIKHQQFPPPGMKVIRDTPIQTGKRALITGYILFFLASSIILLFGASYIVLQKLILSFK